ncbi:MAG: DUF504 domain-containing protein [Nitrososphaerales archaeon]
MARKGKLEEIFSRAMHADDPALYTVGYRDYDEIKELSLLDFLDVSENFQIIPANRIKYVKRAGEIIYSRSK